MTKKHEKEYFEHEWQAMKESLQLFLVTGSQDHLHDFRVQVKKLRAFLIMADSAVKHPKLQKSFKPVRKIFKQAGHIRNGYINLKLAKTYKIQNDGFILQQDLMMQQASDAFRLKGFEYLKELKDARKEIRTEIKPISNEHITFYYTGQLHYIAASMADIRFDESLHQCRKWIKVLMYNFKLVHESLEVPINRAYLDDIQTAIGNWHDNVLAKELFTDNGLSDQLIIARIDKKHRSLEKKIKQLVKDFYNQATTAVELPVEQIS